MKLPKCPIKGLCIHFWQPDWDLFGNKLTQSLEQMVVLCCVCQSQHKTQDDLVGRQLELRGSSVHLFLNSN